MPKCDPARCNRRATTTVRDSLYGERHLCASCAEFLGYTENPETVRAAELRMERDALHRLNGGWRDYGDVVARAYL